MRYKEEKKIEIRYVDDKLHIYTTMCLEDVFQKNKERNLEIILPSKNVHNITSFRM